MENFLKWALILIIFAGIFIYLWNHYDIFSGSNPGGGGFSLGKFFNFGNASNTSSTFYNFSFPSWVPNFSGGSFSYGVAGNVGGSSISAPGYVPDSAIPQGFTRGQLSPYFKQIRVGSVSSGSFFANGSTLVQLYSSLPGNLKVDITGWHVKGNHGDVALPQAVYDYNPHSLNTESDIVISSGSTVSIYQGTSPISRNLRLNQCTGFLQTTYNFNPAIPQNCPALYNRNDILGLAGFCQSYILSLGACQTPSTAFVNSLPGSPEGNACQQYLSTLTVNSCYDKHFSDPGFFSNTWVIWSNQINAFDQQHDFINLYDNKGLLVDQYVY